MVQSEDEKQIGKCAKCGTPILSTLDVAYCGNIACSLCGITMTKSEVEDLIGRNHYYEKCLNCESPIPRGCCQNADCVLFFPDQVLNSLRKAVDKHSLVYPATRLANLAASRPEAVRNWKMACFLFKSNPKRFRLKCSVNGWSLVEVLQPYDRAFLLACAAWGDAQTSTTFDVKL